MLINFVDFVDFWQNIDVECRPEAEKVVDLHFVRTPPSPPPHTIFSCLSVCMYVFIFSKIHIGVQWNWEELKGTSI